MRSAGFSLLEMSIVLVIIGLLTGAIIGGASLLEKAQMRSVISEYQVFQSTLTGFKIKYGALPGDLTDATQIWGWAPNPSAAVSTDAACAALANSAPSQGTRTCNGDGNGVITAGYEEFRTWQHLSNINAIEGRYTGVGSSATAGVGWQPGSNIPKSSFRDAGWRVFYLDSSNRNTYELFNGTYNAHFFSIWGGSGAIDSRTFVFSPAEAYETDQKIDDGLPATGNMVARHTVSAVTTSTLVCALNAAGSAQAVAANTDAIYNTASVVRSCQPYFKADF